MAAFGDRVRRLREARGWSQRELVRLSGVPQSTIWQIEAGRIESPGIDHVRALAGAFGVGVDVLLADVGEQQEQPALADLVAWLESRPDLLGDLDEVRRGNEPDVYREVLESLALAWEANIRMAMRQFRLGGRRQPGR